ncbi:alpha/beta-hydrolase [Thozetella sp. PMI_491]|nr:alpha/beta-hydrolase [Thozetella sp. PMI_491]
MSCLPLTFYFPKTTSPTQFNITVDPQLIELAHDKARTFRPSGGMSADWLNEGPPNSSISLLRDHWVEEFDWTAVQDRINQDFDHYAITVPGNRNYTADIPIHFVHKKSNNSSAIPILLIHGWTSTLQEWSKVAGPLADDGFHVVAVDLPGYGFSPAPTQPGLGPRAMGIAYDILMRQLGYENYGLVTTDLGFPVGMWMMVDSTERIIGHFTDFYFIDPTEDDLARYTLGQTTQEETDYIAAAQDFQTNHFSYASVQGQKPLALSLAMADSPVGYAGWLWDLIHAASDGYNYTLDEIITDTMLLWIQAPYGSMRLYTETFMPEVFSYPKTAVPMGVTQWGNINGPFPGIAKYPLAPREWIERRANVTYFKRYDSCGHFPAIKCPDQWLSDVHGFFSGA